MRALIFSVLLVSSAAHAHFRFLQADGGSIDWLGVNSDGDPTNGNQKTNPCGTGTVKTGRVTTLTAGQVYGVRIEETITHGGHYRVAIAVDAGSFPQPTAASDCSSRTPPPVAPPVLVDGQLQHGQLQPFSTPQTINITVPNTPGRAWLQVVEFMTPHTPPCFYYHCAQIDIVGPTGGGTAGTGGGAAGGGSAGGSAGGAAGGDAGGAGGGTAATGGGTSGTGGGAAGGTGSTGGGTGGGLDEPTGCACTAGGASGLVLLLAAVRVLRRRRY